MAKPRVFLLGKRARGEAASFSLGATRERRNREFLGTRDTTVVKTRLPVTSLGRERRFDRGKDNVDYSRIFFLKLVT